MNKEIILPEFVKLFIEKSKEHGYPICILMQTPRKGELVSGPMDDMIGKLHEYTTIHKCEGDINSLALESHSANAVGQVATPTR